MEDPEQAIGAGRRAPGDRLRDGGPGALVRVVVVAVGLDIAVGQQRREEDMEAFGELAGCSVAQVRRGDRRRPLVDVLDGARQEAGGGHAERPEGRLEAHEDVVA